MGVTLPEGSGTVIPYEAIAGAVGSLHKQTTPQDLLSKGEHKRQRQPLLVTGLLALAILVVMALYLLMPFYFEGKRLEEMDRQIALHKGEARKVELMRTGNEKLKAEIGVIEDFERKRAHTLAMTKELNGLFPKSVWFTRLRVSDASIDLEGYAKSAVDCLAKLRASKTFAKAEFVSPPMKDQRTNSERFAIKIELENRQVNGVEKGKIGRPEQKKL
jgi:Tfp pilus assembly protein PilN